MYKRRKKKLLVLELYQIPRYYFKALIHLHVVMQPLKENARFSLVCGVVKRANANPSSGDAFV
jgi:hypothetical protein